MDPLAWSALLLLLGLTLVVLEVFVPSGGMLGFLSMSQQNYVQAAIYLLGGSLFRLRYRRYFQA